MWRLRTRTCCQTARRCPPCYPWCSPLRVVCGGLVVLCRFSCVAVPVAVYMPSAALVSLRVSRLGHLFSPTKKGRTHTEEATSSSRILPRSMPLLRRSDRAGSARRPPPARRLHVAAPPPRRWAPPRPPRRRPSSYRSVRRARASPCRACRPRAARIKHNQVGHHPPVDADDRRVDAHTPSGTTCCRPTYTESASKGLRLWESAEKVPRRCRCREAASKGKRAVAGQSGSSRTSRAPSSGGRQPCRRRWSGCSSSGRCGSESHGRTAARCPGGSTCRTPATPLTRRPRERPCRRWLPLLLERAGQVRAQHLLRRAHRRKLLRLGQHPVATQPRRADKPPPAVARLVRPKRAAGAASVALAVFHMDGPPRVPAALNLFVHPPADLRNVLLPPSSALALRVCSASPSSALRRLWRRGVCPLTALHLHQDPIVHTAL